MKRQSGQATFFSVDQKVSAALTLFGRVGSAQTGGPRDSFLSFGFQLKNGVIFNPEDSWGVGVAKTELGAGDAEDLVEAYYNLRMTQKMQLSFHLAHVTEKPVAAAEVSYIVPGVRFQAAF